ncbi:MAG: DUF92 domain-containing protein [Gemmatimonadaceae bacterium]
MSLPVRIIVGFIAAGLIALLARRARALSPTGAIAAMLVGTVAVAAGWSWAILVIAYFVTSTILSRAGRQRKAARTAGVVAKPGARDAWQVMSNGLPFTVAALLAVAGVAPVQWLIAAGAGSLAASAADTWATEIGTWVGQPPRSIISGRKLGVGESGGITAAGSVASIAGAAFIAAVAAALWRSTPLFLPLTAAGIAGSLADSVAGALLQRRSWCDACDVTTEMRVHTCGAPTRHTGGISFVENDLVNLGATIVGALTAILLIQRLA